MGSAGQGKLSAVPHVAGPVRGSGERPVKTTPEHWKPGPDDHDFPAAADYLSLLFEDGTVSGLVSALRTAPLSHRKAKDLLRASRLPLLAPDNPHVAQDLDKIKTGRRLSPVLLVRGNGGRGVALIVADGYHRICASYHVDENADIPCRVVNPPGEGPLTS
jgi:hypothetical protein